MKLKPQQSLHKKHQIYSCPLKILKESKQELLLKELIIQISSTHILGAAST
jgi:hypothetical protein